MSPIDRDLYRFNKIPPDWDVRKRHYDTPRVNLKIVDGGVRYRPDHTPLPPLVPISKDVPKLHPTPVKSWQEMRKQKGISPAEMAGRAALVLTTLAGIAYGIYLGEKVYFEEDGTRSSLYGKMIEGKANRTLVTDPYNADAPFIPVRRKMSLADKDIVAYVKPGERIEATGVWGTRYESRYGLGDDGTGNGQWYVTFTPLPAYELVVKDGKEALVRKTGKDGEPLDVSGVYIAANFLKIVSAQQAGK